VVLRFRQLGPDEDIFYPTNVNKITKYTKCLTAPGTSVKTTAIK